MSIEANLKSIRKKIEFSCEKAHRSVSEIELLAVSKKQPITAIEEAYKVGQKNFGENYVQEWRQKSQEMGNSETVSYTHLTLPTNREV